MIKNLMFDLGGVIMDIKRDNAVAALQRLGVANADELLGAYAQKGVFLALERGDITPEQFRAEIRSGIDHPVSDKQIDDAFSEFLIGIPADRLDQLRQLRKKYGIYLLSNTNAIMWYGKISDEFAKQGHNIDFYFDGVVASFDVHAYKPDDEIFLIAARKFSIKPEETLFYDDSRANVEAARKLGFKAVHVDDPDRTFESYIEEAR